MSAAQKREVLQDRAMGMEAVFRPLQRREQRQKLDVETLWGEATIRWRAPDQLGIGEQSVLLAVLEVAYEQRKDNQPVMEADGLWHALGHTDAVFMSQLVRVVTSYRRLALLAGGHDGGGNLQEVRESLKRLTETTVWVRLDKIEGCSRLLTWEVGDENTVVLALNWRLTQAVQGKGYARISMHERALLHSERAKALHAVLSCKVDVGRAWEPRLEHLQRYVWGDTLTEGSARRQRHARLRDALADIQLLPGWTATVSGDTVRVARGLAGRRGPVAEKRLSCSPAASATLQPGPARGIGAGFQRIDVSALVEARR